MKLAKRRSEENPVFQASGNIWGEKGEFQTKFGYLRVAKFIVTRKIGLLGRFPGFFCPKKYLRPAPALASGKSQGRPGIAVND